MRKETGCGVGRNAYRIARFRQNGLSNAGTANMDIALTHRIANAQKVSRLAMFIVRTGSVLTGNAGKLNDALSQKRK